MVVADQVRRLVEINRKRWPKVTSEAPRSDSPTLYSLPHTLYRLATLCEIVKPKKAQISARWGAEQNRAPTSVRVRASDGLRLCVYVCMCCSRLAAKGSSKATVESRNSNRRPDAPWCNERNGSFELYTVQYLGIACLPTREQRWHAHRPCCENLLYRDFSVPWLGTVK